MIDENINMAKEKQTRTYDPDGFRRRAACLCVRDPEEKEIMLVTSSRAPQYWIVPGGGIEPNEDPNEAAIRETEEEAGVKGIIKRSLGDIEVWEENMVRKHRTWVFVLEVKEELDVWEDSKCRKRCWFSINEALKLLAIYKPIQCNYVKIMIETSPSSSLRQLLSSPSFLKLFPSSSSCNDDGTPIISSSSQQLQASSSSSASNNESKKNSLISEKSNAMNNNNYSDSDSSKHTNYEKNFNAMTTTTNPTSIMMDNGNDKNKPCDTTLIKKSTNANNNNNVTNNSDDTKPSDCNITSTLPSNTSTAKNS